MTTFVPAYREPILRAVPELPEEAEAADAVPEAVAEAEEDVLIPEEADGFKKEMFAVRP